MKHQIQQLPRSKILKNGTRGPINFAAKPRTVKAPARPIIDATIPSIPRLPITLRDSARRIKEVHITRIDPDLTDVDPIAFMAVPKMIRDPAIAVKLLSISSQESSDKSFNDDLIIEITANNVPIVAIDCPNLMVFILFINVAIISIDDPIEIIPFSI